MGESMSALPRAVGIELAGERPTAEETTRLELLAKARFSEPYKLKLIVACDVPGLRHIVRLVAYPEGMTL